MTRPACGGRAETSRKCGIGAAQGMGFEAPVAPVVETELEAVVGDAVEVGHHGGSIRMRAVDLEGCLDGGLPLGGQRLRRTPEEVAHEVVAGGVR